MKIDVLQFSTGQHTLCVHSCTSGTTSSCCSAHRTTSFHKYHNELAAIHNTTTHGTFLGSKINYTHTHLSAVGSPSITTDTTDSLWRRRLLLSWSCWPSCKAVCCCNGLRLISRGRHFGKSFVIWSLLAPLMQSCKLSNCSRLVMAPRHVPGSTLPPVSVVGTPAKT